MQAENKDLRLALEDYQKALEQIMSKYRQQTAYFLKQTKKNAEAEQSAKCCAEKSECKCVNVSSYIYAVSYFRMILFIKDNFLLC